MIKRNYVNHGVEQFGSFRGERLGRTPFKRCIHCNFPNDTRKTAWSKQGDGLGPATDVYAGDTLQSNIKDHAVQSGCAFCGSLYWQKSKPVALPEGSNLPSEENRRRRFRR